MGMSVGIDGRFGNDVTVSILPAFNSRQTGLPNEPFPTHLHLVFTLSLNPSRIGTAADWHDTADHGG